VGNQIREDEMGRACNMHGGQDKKYMVFGGKTQRKETT